MGNLDGFDASTVDPLGDFSPIPEGDYLSMIIASGFELTKDKSGEFLKFEFEICDGEHRGRRLFDRLNLRNSNATAVKIAQATLSSLCRAIGILRPRDSSELHNKLVVIHVGLEERKDKPGVFSNRIKNYYSPNEQTQRPASSPAAAAAAAPTQQQQLPPWKRKAS